jgi:hypothetical protein
MYRWAHIAALTILVSAPTALSADQPPKFYGSVITTWLDDGRHMKLMQPFSFTDQRNVKWEVPAGAIVDGASIPQAVWTFVGGPLEGKYRKASVLHDWYCDRRTRPW